MTEDKPFNLEYVFSMSNYAGRILMTMGKYITLVSGIHAVCKDEPDFLVAGACGISYLIADALKEAFREKAEVEKLSILEKKIKN